MRPDQRYGPKPAVVQIPPAPEIRFPAHESARRNQVPPKVEYALTDIGQTIEPVLKVLCGWGTEYRRLVDEREE